MNEHVQSKENLVLPITAQQPLDSPRGHRVLSLKGYLLVLLLPPLILGWMAGISEMGSVVFNVKAAHIGFALLTFYMNWFCYEGFTYIGAKVAASLRWPFWVALLFALVCTGLLHAPLTIIRDGLFAPFLAPGSTFFATWPWNFGDKVYATEAALNFSTRIVVWIGWNAIILHVMRYSRFGFTSVFDRAPRGPLPGESIGTRKPSVGRGIARLYERLPGHNGKRILYMSAQEHYTKVYTEKASELIYMRFADAMALAETAIAGQRVHRSFWVAQDAVSEFKRDGSKISLILENGDLIPVSRSYREMIRDWERGLV